MAVMDNREAMMMYSRFISCSLFRFINLLEMQPLNYLARYFDVYMLKYLCRFRINGQYYIIFAPILYEFIRREISFPF